MQDLNIDRIGPGGWYMIHLMCAHAKTEEQIESVHNVLEMISKHFFCLRCRNHFRSNYINFPPPKVNKYDELFIWSVEMHNKVNVLNNKPIIEYREALEQYTGKDSTCTGDCGAKKPESLSMSELLLRVLSSGESSKFRSQRSEKRSL